MKKALLLSIIALFMQPITASTEVTFFDPKDVDSNGWLWFDTQEKINRYVGITDDKLIQWFLLPMRMPMEKIPNPLPVPPLSEQALMEKSVPPEAVREPLSYAKAIESTTSQEEPSCSIYPHVQTWL